MPDFVIARRALLAALAGSAWAHRSAGAAALRERHPRPLPHRHLIAVDPGHGGTDPGAIGAGDVYEKEITLATALELARQLERTDRFRALLTRRTNLFVPLRERVARARRHSAELFLSIHADTFSDPATRGLSVYTLSDQASDRETAALAARENKADLIGGVNLSRQPREIGQILLDLERRQTMNRSRVLAQDVVTELGHDVTLLEKPHRSAGFAVLTAPDIPSVLVEIGTLSNPAEERLLRQPAYRRRIAQGLVRAIERYFAAYGGA
ncbi:MAG TPA: N-acetylmuramoyl-L-alanine amidase [Stellaceae bacterium]|jgi:N-acetylmuramoyl-L-alanine amidase|nr:N-acetylmuramoyl-L-alanine amidase [Stellaceae bacterium]